MYDLIDLSGNFCCMSFLQLTFIITVELGLLRLYFVAKRLQLLKLLFYSEAVSHDGNKFQLSVFV